MKRFTQFVEVKERTAVFTFGRFNPPTIGHQKLIQSVNKVARKKGGKPFIFASYSQDKKKNPLTHNQKMHYLSKMFPSEMRGQKPVLTKLNTAIDVAVHLNDYDHLVMVVGSDRVDDFQNLLSKYNGVDARHGRYDYKTIEVVSAGDRDPDAEGVTGMSASKMRAAAGSGDYDSFKLGLPKGYDGEDLFNNVRKGMGIKRELPSLKPISKLNSEEWLREQYFQDLIFNIGDWAKCSKTGKEGEVVKRGTNYITVVESDFSLHKIWLHDAEMIEEDKKPELPSGVLFLKNRNLWEKFRNNEALEVGTAEYNDYLQKLTPGEQGHSKLIRRPSLKYQTRTKELMSKFKIPKNVAEALVKKFDEMNINPLEIKTYSTLLSTYLNLMDEKIPEVAPPGKERVVKALKKKWPDNLKRVYATAWYQYNKERGKNE